MCSCISRPEPYHVFTWYVHWGWSLQGTSLGVYVDLSDPAGVYENIRQVIFPCPHKPSLNCFLVSKSEHNWVVCTIQPWVQYQVEKLVLIKYYKNNYFSLLRLGVLDTGNSIRLEKCSWSARPRNGYSGRTFFFL